MIAPEPDPGQKPFLGYAEPRARPDTFRAIVVSLLLLVGVQMWLVFGRGYWGRNDQLKLLAVVLVISCLPPVYRAFARLYDAVRSPPRSAIAVASVLVALFSSTYLYLDARYQKRTFTPKYHDEFSYIVQTRMVAQGRLWAPAHPLPQFFESFQLVAEPVYGSIYFPGAAVLYAPGVWFGWPHWVIPLLLSGTAVGLTFRIIAELIDAVAGLLAAMMLVSLPIFRLQSLMAMSAIPALLLGLAMIWAWLNWRRKHSIGWAILIGAIAGWAAITRPADALCAAVPVGVAMLVEFRRRRLPFATVAHTCLAIFLAAAPFLLVQVVFNRFAGGRVLQTPFQWYAIRNYPQTYFGFHAFDPHARPMSALPQKQVYYDTVALPFIKSHRPLEMLTNWRDNRLRLTVVADAPNWLMIALMPVGLLGLTDARRWVLWSMFPLFVVLYFFYTFFLAHYPLIAAPAVILDILIGADVLARTWPRARSFLTTLLTLVLAALTISELPEFNRVAHDEWFEAPQLAKIDRALAELEHKPAVVLFRFGGGANCEEEPVYNADVIYPDFAPVIRAHDLGPYNVMLYRYYAKRGPDRAVYLYDRADDTIRYLGSVRELAAKTSTTTTTTTTNRNLQ